VSVLSVILFNLRLKVLKRPFSTQYSIVKSNSVLYRTVLYCTVLYCTVLYCTALQVLAGIICTLPGISSGLSMGFSAVLIPQLQEQGADIQISLEEGSWIGIS